VGCPAAERADVLRTRLHKKTTLKNCSQLLHRERAKPYSTPSGNPQTVDFLYYYAAESEAEPNPARHLDLYFVEFSARDLYRAGFVGRRQWRAAK
jgi:hypothetical protein